MTAFVINDIKYNVLMSNNVCTINFNDEKERTHI